MAWQVGDTAFVPASKFEVLRDHPTAFYETRVVAIGGRRLQVNLPRGANPEWIGSSLCHRNIGILVLNIGDFETEDALLDPLAKSVLQFCRLLAADNYVRAFKIRSVKELKHVWATYQRVYSHVILIGHGKEDGILFHSDGWVDAAKLEAETQVRGAPRKTFISLCCKTGYKSFGGAFSAATICEHFIAPFHSVHGAIASQFCQSFLAYHLLEGETVGVAFRHARESTPGSTSFRLWENDTLKAGPA